MSATAPTGATRRPRGARSALLAIIALALAGLPAMAGAVPVPVVAAVGSVAPAVSVPAAVETADWVPFVGTPQLWCTRSNPGGGNFCINAGHHSYMALDIGMSEGSTIRAAGPGTVIDLNNTCNAGDMSCGAGRGRFVAIQHPDGRVSRYLHLSSVGVAMSQKVSRGQVIGLSGSTGGSTAPHLHYDEQQPYGTNVDPGPMAALVNGSVKSYPADLGYANWWVTPYGTTIRNDGYSSPLGVGDFSGDGSGDLAVYDPGSGVWRVQGLADVTLGGPGQVPVPGDYAGSGTTKRATYEAATGVWRVEGLADVTLGGPGQVPVPADFDGDGKVERATYDPANGMWRVHGVGSAQWGGPGQVPVPADFDGDGSVERATYEPATGVWRVQGLADVTLGGPGQVPVPGDYAGSGTTKRATYEAATGVWRVEGLADVTLGGPGQVPVPSDVDGDGGLDRVTYSAAAGAWAVEGGLVLPLGGPRQIPVSSSNPWVSWTASTRTASETDLDGDARGDAGAWRATTGQWLRSGQTPVAFGQAGDVPLLGDLNGDGTNDRTVYRPSAGVWFTQAPGFLPFSVATAQPADQPVLADTDGDGIDEPMIFRPGTGRLLRLGGASTVIGVEGDVAVWGDEDGDGRDEVGTFRPATGTWSFAGEAPVTFGQEGDVPMLADVNGDLRAERLLFRPGATTWFVGLPGWWPVAFGQPGDVPMAIDGNGDTRAELGVFRPSSGEYLAYGAAPVAVGQVGDLPVPRADGAAPVPSGAPSAVAAVAGDGSATLSWTAPTANGGSPVVGYRIVTSPGGATTDVWGAVPTATVTGLTNAVAYTATVRALTVAGVGGPAASPSFTPVGSVEPPATAGGMHPLVPSRILDTRDGTGGSAAPFGPGESRELVMTGAGGVPATGVSAVAVNVTITAPSAPTHLTVWPTGQPRPTASSVNAVEGQTVANLVVARVGTGGRVSIFNNSGTAHVIADVVGWIDEDGGGARFNGLPPDRILDTRDGTGGFDTPFGPGASRDLVVTGTGGVPATTPVAAVVVNVTVTGPSAPTHLTVWPAGTARPTASNLNAPAGTTVPNLVVASVGAGGAISIFNNAGSADVIVDVVGYYSASGGLFTGVTPARILDTRSPGTGVPVPFGPGEARSLTVAGVGGVPAEGVAAVVVNVTVTGPTAPSHVTVWPSGFDRPNASNLNVGAGQTVPNLVMVWLGDDGTISLFNNSGSLHVIVDVVGYMT